MRPYYEQRLASCGYNKKLTYQQQGENIKNNEYIGKNPKRNVIWFRSPYSKSLITHIGKYFFRLLNKHFPPGHKLHKIFNKKTLKLSYSCMSNLIAKIDGHNKKILENTPLPKTKLSNCLKKENSQSEEPALLKMFYTTLEYVVTTKQIDRSCIKEFAKLFLKNDTQIIKNLSMRKRTRTILNYLLNTGSWEIGNFTHKYSGV